MTKLDAFKPTLEAVVGIKRQLVDAGIEPSAIPEDWIPAILAATNKWYATNPDGFKYLVNALGFSWDRGSDERDYEYYNTQTGEVYPIPSDKVVFFSGVSINGYPVSQDLVSSLPKVQNNCDSCGISSHCVKEFRDPVKDRMESLCNCCLSMDEARRSRHGGDPSICNRCTLTSCAHHPRRTKRA